MKHILQVWRDDGVPKDVPLMVTESHLAAQLTGPMSTIFAGLWLADNIGSFFEGGGAAFYHSPIQPQGLQNSCLGWASWSNFVAPHEYDITGYTSLYLRRPHDQSRVGAASLRNASDVSLIERKLRTARAMRSSRPTPSIAPTETGSIMLVNRDESNPHSVRVTL